MLQPSKRRQVIACARTYAQAAISPEDFEADDYRRQSPRFQGENFARNLELVAKVTEFAADIGATPSQLALAWVLAKGDDLPPIPGAKRRKYLEENAAAVASRGQPPRLVNWTASFHPVQPLANDMLLT